MGERLSEMPQHIILSRMTLEREVTYTWRKGREQEEEEEKKKEKEEKEEKEYILQERKDLHRKCRGSRI